MVWLVIVIALAIPLAAVILDSPVVRAWVDRRVGGGEVPADMKELAKRVGVLESELETMTRQVEQLRDEHQFVQRLLEDPNREPTPKSLPKSGS
jgi:hypothetical protein